MIICIYYKGAFNCVTLTFRQCLAFFTVDLQLFELKCITDCLLGYEITNLIVLFLLTELLRISYISYRLGHC